MTRADALAPAGVTAQGATAETFELSPLFRAERRSTDGGCFAVAAGQGATRQIYDIDGDDSGGILTWLLSVSAAPLDDLERSVAQQLEVEPSGAHKLCELLIEAQVLVSGADAAKLRESGRQWEAWGWRDAFDFHASFHGDSFMAYDTEQFRDLIDELVADARNIGPQPSPYKEYEGRETIPLRQPKELSGPRVTLEKALLDNWPVAYFNHSGVELNDVVQLLGAAFGVQHEVDDAFLGPHLLKSYPSGGARHPIEVYLAARDVHGLAPGIYHYNPGSHVLVPVNGASALDPMNDACFQKPGIETASAVLFMTVRWFRHNWKYRYPRSYRMVLIEVGHAIQTACLTGALTNAQVYSSYAINDAAVSDMLALSDDCDELPVMALALGMGGVV
ncbi:SagB/ThcOx family dehydrogenase [Kribbella sp. NPDC049174]|uniref:SagB/ThcOx family dehydrogenase n=1 Tax=Kribbella sp. NPDC049174 TaxID=3364112 RepID=UPI0037128BA3